MPGFDLRRGVNIPVPGLCGRASIMARADKGGPVRGGNPLHSRLLKRLLSLLLVGGWASAFAGGASVEDLEVSGSSRKDPISSGVSRDADGGKGVGVSKQTRPIPNQHEILPILMRHCWACHGAVLREVGLDLRDHARMLKGGKSGPALIPGDPAASLMIRRIVSGECPPAKRLVEANVKPLSRQESETIENWIAGGALEAASSELAPIARKDLREVASDPAYWAFRKPKERSIPPVRSPDLVRNPIDRFVLSKLESAGLSFAPEASKEVLMRRVFFAVTGLPPSPAEAQRFLTDSEPGAYDRLVERLLASPRYGERWGRYWLDVAGYSDVEGRREQHLPRPFAYRYRDYVIQSMNADKPYDRFLTEQIAGDDLCDGESLKEPTSEIYDNLVATGFLRMGPDPTWANITGFIPDRLDVIADAMDVLGSGVLGLTLKCARCHDHKFDPLTHRDYYKMTDLFKGAYDEYNWLKPDQRPYGGAGNTGPLGERSLPHVLPEERRAWQDLTRETLQRIETLTTAIRAAESALTEKFRREQIDLLPEAVRDGVRAMLRTEAAKRSDAQRQIAVQFEQKLTPDRNALKAMDSGFKKLCEDLAASEALKRPEPRIAALWDRGEASPTYLYLRGDAQRAGPLVTGGSPSVFDGEVHPMDMSPARPGVSSTGRRLALARWLTQPGHPLTARVMVNRVWKLHFNRGIVDSLDNFGRAGNRPTHPELLDWLALHFESHGWSLKSLHRLMLTSRTFLQSTVTSTEAARLDFENKLLSRMPLRRLDAEAFWDTCLSVAGCLIETRFGPAVPVRIQGDGSVWPGKTQGGWRRAIYGQQLRKEIPTLLELFDLPPMNPNCVRRSESIAATQALHLMNDSVVREIAGNFARRVLTGSARSTSLQVEHAYELALCRKPSLTELASASDFIRNAEAEWRQAGVSGKDRSPGQAGADVTPEERAWGTFCHALINSAEFLYVD